MSQGSGTVTKFLTYLRLFTSRKFNFRRIQRIQNSILVAADVRRLTFQHSERSEPPDVGCYDISPFSKPEPQPSEIGSLARQFGLRIERIQMIIAASHVQDA